VQGPLRPGRTGRGAPDHRRLRRRHQLGKTYRSGHLDKAAKQRADHLIGRERRSRSVGGIFVTHDTRMTDHADRAREVIDGRVRA
jgi:predicted ABC-type transport system involved in lysophospholipase L1 biosynthesis ATPase subunit